MTKKSKILLTQEQIENWEAERARIEAELELLKWEHRTLSAKLAAAYLLDPDRDETTVLPASVPQRLSASIQSLLNHSPEALTRNQLKLKLRSLGIDNPSLDAGHFYQLMARLVKKGNLYRDGDYYSARPFAKATLV